ncbi:MAG: DUF4493 domain-containing protein [Muribaculaceae bacterium]
MKKILNTVMAVGMVAAMLTSCSDEKMATEGEGAVRFSVKLDGEPEVVTRASNEASLAENCIVYIYNSKGLIRKYRGTNNVPDRLYLASGNYRVTTAAGDSVPASFTDRYFKGAQDFVITAGSETQVNVVCKIANSVVVVDFGNIAEALSDYKLVVKNAGGELEFTSDMAGTKGYFMMDDGETSLNWTISGTQLNGSTYEKSGVIENVKPAYLYTLTASYSSTPVEYGGALITIDVAEEEIVTKEVTVTAAPKFMLNAGRDVNQPVVSQPEAFVSNVIVYCTSACALKSVYVSAQDNVFTNVFGLPDNEFELFSMSEDFSSTLASAGFSYTYEYNTVEDNAVAKIIFAKDMLNKLGNGDYYVNFTATDVKDKVRTYEMHLQITDASVATVTINGDEVYTSRATIHGTVLKSDLTGLKMRYRVQGAADWITVDATVSGNDMSAEITGLTQNTTYEYQAICDGFVIADVKTFTTEEAAQLPNSSFEDWQTSSSPYLIYPSDGEMFWDSGNHGSSTLNKNVTLPSTSNVVDGTYSIDLKSQFVGLGFVGKFAAGNVFVGKYIRTDGTDGVIGWGRPFYSRPKSLTGYVKYSPVTIDNNSGAVDDATGMDKGHIFIVLWDDSKETDSSSGESWPKIINTKTTQLFDPTSEHIIAYGELVLTEETELGQFEIVLNYRSNKKPSAIMVTCSASKYGDYFCGGNGSEMWLDNFQLTYE